MEFMFQWKRVINNKINSVKLSDVGPGKSRVGHKAYTIWKGGSEKKTKSYFKRNKNNKYQL